MEITHARSTWAKVKEFQRGLEELGKRVELSLIRRYLLTGEKSREVPRDVYKEADRLKEIREQGIQNEMQYCLAQAELNGITLSEDIQSGKDIRPFFSKKVLEKVPSLDIYTHFMWYSEEELEKLKTEALDAAGGVAKKEESKGTQEAPSGEYR